MKVPEFKRGFKFTVIFFIFYILSLWVSFSYAGVGGPPFSSPCSLYHRSYAPTHSPSLQPLLRQFAHEALLSPLTEEMKIHLKAHSIWKKFSNYPHSENLEFTFLFVNQGTLRAGEIKKGEMGESIQSHFIAMTLRELFPAANVFGDLTPLPPSKKRIKIYSLDLAEGTFHSPSMQVKSYEGKFFMDMNLLKRANSRVLTHSKKEVRRILGIPEQTFVINDYGSGFYTRNTSESMNALKNIPELQNKNILVFSSSAEYILNKELILKQLNEFHPEMKFHFFSQLTSTSLSKETKDYQIVFNDLLGLMPLVNQAADLAIVDGPINLFEGLNAGVPTLIIPLSPNTKSYDYDTYNLLKQTALKTGGALEIATELSLLQAIEKSVQEGMHPHTPSSFVLNEEGKTAFELYLDALERILTSSLGDPQRNVSP